MKTMKTMLAGILMLCLAVSCKHDEVLEDTAAGLPKETMIGANTFGCKINGKPWIAGVNPLLMEFPPLKKISTSWATDRRAVWIIGNHRTETTREQGFVLRLENIPLKPAFSLDIKDTYNSGLHRSSCLFRGPNSQITPTQYHTSPTRTGWVEITRLDTVARIIAGRFEFSMQVEGGDSVLNVTDGRFDIKF